MHDVNSSGWTFVLPLIAFIVIAVVSILPSLLTIGKSGSIASFFQNLPDKLSWLFLIALLAFLIITLVNLIRKSDTNDNKYGPNPHEVTP